MSGNKQLCEEAAIHSCSHYMQNNSLSQKETCMLCLSLCYLAVLLCTSMRYQASQIGLEPKMSSDTHFEAPRGAQKQVLNILILYIAMGRKMQKWYPGKVCVFLTETDIRY